MVGADPHLITPVHCCPLPLGVSSDSRIFPAQPAADCHRVELVGPPDRFLRCETPASQVSPHCPDRKPKTESTDDEISHGFSCPEDEGQLELVGAAIGEQSHGRCCLPWCQPNDRWPAAPVRSQSPHSILPPSTVPSVDGLTRDAEDPCCLGLGHPLTNGTDHSATESVLSAGGQTSCVLSIHKREDTAFTSKRQIFSAPINKSSYRRRPWK